MLYNQPFEFILKNTNSYMVTYIRLRVPHFENVIEFTQSLFRTITTIISIVDNLLIICIESLQEVCEHLMFPLVDTHTHHSLHITYILIVYRVVHTFTKYTKISSLFSTKSKFYAGNFSKHIP